MNTLRRNTRTAVRRTALAAAVTAAALVLAACGGDDSGSGDKPSPSASASEKTGAHNKADVSFATGMIPHHRQAVEMADLAETRASSSKVKDLAEKIKKAQDPEITTMSGWLKAWGEKVPEDMSGMDHGGMDHGDDSEMPGMMDGKDMEKMKKSEGKDFDTMFLNMMIEHHEGAVEMSQTEKKKGAYGPATSLADDIIAAQNAEIAQMRKLLGKD
ncbi:DUF305 domain-containing protein [Streptomyces armeniacus]|uniref:DUF305 domain-containing protein n=1 Tax=Streptomyces armeniacus TaxID=83291 RepID=A0A345XRX9_9ACTN|nr:DUF305 domain-containing protein [Streptomyces armeniacus]AXK34395.1 DUF305 domain-containing protein [Streptomyces armeniacus]